MKRVVTILFLFLLAVPNVALAAKDQHAGVQSTPAWLSSSHKEDPDPPPPPPAASRVRTFACVFVVLSLIGFAIWTKAKKRTLTAKNPAAYVKVTDSVKIGDKAHLVVATFGKRTMVLGVTEHGIRRIADLDTRAERLTAERSADETTGEKSSQTQLATARAQVAPLSSFGARLGALIRDVRVGEAPETATNDEEEFVTPVSRPLLRVANDTRDKFDRSSGAHATDPIEEQVSGLLAARARRL